MAINASPIPSGAGYTDALQCASLSTQQFDAKVNILVKPIELKKKAKKNPGDNTVYEAIRPVTGDLYQLIVNHNNYDGALSYAIWHDTTKGAFQDPPRKTMIRANYGGGLFITEELPGKSAFIPDTSCSGKYGSGDPLSVFLYDEKLYS